MKATIKELKKKKRRDFNALNIGAGSDITDPRHQTTIKSGVGSGAIGPYRGDIAAATNYRP